MNESDRGLTTPSEEAAMLATETSGVWFRAALERVDSGPAKALIIELTTGSTPEDFEWQSWDLGHLIFISGTASGPVASDWLTTRGGEMRGERGVVPFSLAGLPGSGSWQRLPSRSPYDRPHLPWPSRRASFSSGQMIGPSSRPSFLVGPSAPSFPSFEAAKEAFFHDRSESRPQAGSSDLLVVRHQFEQVRIDRVLFSATAVEVRLGAPAGFVATPRAIRVEFGGNIRHEPTRVFLDRRSDNRSLTFDLPAGIPDEWWVVLSDGNKWLDFRQFSRYGRWPEDAEHLRGALDPNDEAQMLMLDGETVVMEFKGDLPKDDSGKRKLCRTVAAFANGQGGTILFGIDRDEVTVVGMSESFAVCRDRLADIVSGNLTPRPEVEIRPLVTDQGLVVALVVGKGSNPPYGVDPRNPRYFVRRNATTTPALQDEVISLARNAHAVSRPPWAR